jgi:hypothetical protein
LDFRPGEIASETNPTAVHQVRHHRGDFSIIIGKSADTLDKLQ